VKLFRPRTASKECPNTECPYGFRRHPEQIENVRADLPDDEIRSRLRTYPWVDLPNGVNRLAVH